MVYKNVIDKPSTQRPEWGPNPVLASLPAVSAQDHRACMRNVASAVSIITAQHGQRQAGLTATAVVSVTADPPRLAVFVNKDVAAAEVILQSGALCVNVLSSAQDDVAKAFAGMLEGVHGEARFLHGEWQTMVTSSPVLVGALVSFDCRVVNVHDESTHHAFVCEVLATTGCADESALVYLNGAFRHLSMNLFHFSGNDR